MIRYPLSLHDTPSGSYPGSRIWDKALWQCYHQIIFGMYRFSTHPVVESNNSLRFDMTLQEQPLALSNSETP